MTGRVVAVVLNFRGWPGIADTLRALANEVPLSDIVVVDNASGDGSTARIAAGFPGARVIEAPENGGYASGMNLGVASTADSEFVLLLTHECVLEPGAVRSLAAVLDAHPEAGLAAPLLGRASDGTVWSAGGVVKRRSGQPRHLGAGVAVADLRGTASSEVMWADGAALLLRRRALAEVGGLDERFFLYDEEVDLALRLRAQGWTVRLVPEALAWQEPGSGGTPAYLEVRNRLLLWRFHRRPLLAAAAIAYSAYQVGVDLLAGRPRRAWLRWCGLAAAVTGRLDRRRAQVRQRVSAE